MFGCLAEVVRLYWYMPLARSCAHLIGYAHECPQEMSNARVLSLSDDIFAKLQREINDSTSLVQVRDLQQVSKYVPSLSLSSCSVS